MAAQRSGEIRCPGCNQDALLLREPVYEGFQKTGETLKCSSCGHVFEGEEGVPFAGRETVQVFTDADRSIDPEIFEENEASRLCRYCKHYVLNPFMQWCGVHKKEVEATNTCGAFEKAPEPPPEQKSGEDETPGSLL